jgi:hypothetical protein
MSGVKNLPQRHRDAEECKIKNTKRKKQPRGREVRSIILAF